MFKFSFSSQRFIISIIFISLFLQACGSGSGSSDSSTASNDEYEMHSSISGSTSSSDVSGIVSGGIVENALVYILAAGLDGKASKLLGSGYTEKDGFYNVSIPAEYTGAIEILVKADNKLASAATMVCDALPDCGETPWPGLYDANQNGLVDFGEKFSLTNDFSMRAVSYIGSGTDSLFISVTPMSNLAAVFAEAFPQGLDEISINTANSRVANLLGLSDDYFTLPVADITKDLSGFSTEEIIQGIWAGAFLAFVDKVNNTNTVFKQLQNNFVSNDGQLLLSSENTNESLTLDNLLQAAITITEQLLEQNPELIDFKNYLLKYLAESLSVVGELTDLEESPGFGKTPEEQVALLLEDLGYLGEALNLSDTEAFGFTDNISTAKQAMLSDDTLSVLLATGKYALALSLLPDLASNEDILPYACTLLSGFTATLCSSLAEEYTLAEICESNISVMGINFCSVIEPFLVVDIPTLESGLSVTFNILTREVTVTGEVDDQSVDLVFTAPEFYSRENIVAEVEGSISNAFDTFNVQGQFEFDMTADQVSLDEIANLSSEQLSGFLVLASSSLSGTGNFATISFGETSSYTLGFENTLSDGEVIQTTLMGELVNLEPMPESVIIEYNGRELNINHNNDGNILSIVNQDDIEIEIYSDLVSDGQLGSIFVEDVLFANVMREGGVVTVFDLDGNSVDISQVFQ